MVELQFTISLTVYVAIVKDFHYLTLHVSTSYCKSFYVDLRHISPTCICRVNKYLRMKFYIFHCFDFVKTTMLWKCWLIWISFWIFLSFLLQFQTDHGYWSWAKIRRYTQRYKISIYIIKITSNISTYILSILNNILMERILSQVT